MKKTVMAACGVVALGMAFGATGATASSLAGSAAALGGTVQAQTGLQDVAVRRVCHTDWRWVHGRRVAVQSCRTWRNGRWY